MLPIIVRRQCHHLRTLLSSHHVAPLANSAARKKHLIPSSSGNQLAGSAGVLVRSLITRSAFPSATGFLYHRCHCLHSRVTRTNPLNLRISRGLYIGSDPDLDELHSIAEIFHEYRIHLEPRGMAETVEGAVTAVVKEEPRPLVMCGPSGSGKSTLLKKLIKEYPDLFGFSVSHTTRSPRPGEVNGKDYHFVSKDVMEQMVVNHEFIEHATYSGNMYGTSKQAVRDVVHSGRICVLDIDVQGAKQIKMIPDIQPLYIFIHPPSREELIVRLRGRGTETEASLEKRLQAADAEFEYSKVSGAFDVQITNDQLDIAYEKLREAVQEEMEKVQRLRELEETAATAAASDTH